MLEILILVAVSAIGYYYYIREIKGYKSFDKVPGPAGYPLLGNALSFKSSAGKLLYVNIENHKTLRHNFSTSDKQIIDKYMVIKSNYKRNKLQ